MQNALVTLIFYSSVILMMMMIAIRMIITRRNPGTASDNTDHHDAWYYIDPYDIKDKVGEIFHHLVHGTIERIFVRGLIIAERTIRHFDIRLRKGIMRLVNHIDRTKKDSGRSRMADNSRIRKLYEESSPAEVTTVDNTNNPE